MLIRASQHLLFSRSFLLTFSMMLACVSHACEDVEVPVVTTGMLDGEDWSPSGEAPGTFLVVAPKSFKGYTLLDAHLMFGDNSVSIAMKTVDEKPDSGVFYVNGSLDFFETSYVLVQYQGTESGRPCKLAQEVRWGL